MQLMNSEIKEISNRESNNGDISQIVHIVIGAKPDGWDANFPARVPIETSSSMKQRMCANVITVFGRPGALKPSRPSVCALESSFTASTSTK